MESEKHPVLALMRLRAEEAHLASFEFQHTSAHILAMTDEEYERYSYDLAQAHNLLVAAKLTYLDAKRRLNASRN